MNKEEYQDFVLRYKGCGACFPMYHTLSRFEKMWFTAIQKDVAKLVKENAELKVENAFCEKACEGATMMYEHLTKAKEIIKKFSEFANLEVKYDPEHPQEHTDLWNKLCKDAEQFLSEVEK